MVDARHLRRGAILLEVILSLSLFVMGGMAILGAISQAVRGLEVTSSKQRAADLARSAMARLEAGIVTAESLEGPVPPWTDPSQDSGFSFEGEDASWGAMDPSQEPTGWELEVDVEPSPFPGLTLVHIRAVKRPSPESERIEADYTLHQLVRLGALGADEAGEEDELMDEARRGAEEEARGRGPTPGGGGG